jgi:hypothetical protein
VDNCLASGRCVFYQTLTAKDTVKRRIVTYGNGPTGGGYSAQSSRAVGAPFAIRAIVEREQPDAA